MGLWWQRDSWSAGVTLWRSLWDGRQPGEEGADWRGEGGEISYEYYGDRWDVQASVGASRSRNLEQWSRSFDCLRPIGTLGNADL